MAIKSPMFSPVNVFCCTVANFYPSFISIDKPLISKSSCSLFAVAIPHYPSISFGNPLTNYMIHITITVSGNSCGKDIFFNCGSLSIIYNDKHAILCIYIAIYIADLINEQVC